MTHILKILSKFADSILIGFNTFEILENGRPGSGGRWTSYHTRFKKPKIKNGGIINESMEKSKNGDQKL